MRRALLVPLMLMLIVLPMAAVAEQVPLSADLQHGIIIWDQPIVLYKRNGAPPMMSTSIIVGADDVQRILSWPGDTVYVVVYVSGIDAYAGRPVPLQVIIRSGGAQTADTVYSTDYQNIAGRGVYEYAIPKDAIRRAAEVSGDIRIVLHIFDAWSVGNGAPDNYYAISINKVVVAPPVANKLATAQQDAQPAVVVKREESWGLPSDRSLLLGFGVIAVAIVVAAFVFRR